MQNRYIDLIQQAFEFPQNGFDLAGDRLFYHGIDLMEVVREYGTPLRLSYVPIIGEQIEKARGWFRKAMEERDYQGAYHYAYCTKSSHFRFVMEEVLRHGAHLEISSAYDVDIIERLYLRKLLDKDCVVICNGFKSPLYTQRIAKLINLGFRKIVPVLDSKGELEAYRQTIIGDFQVGIRIASEEQPDFAVYTSRLGIRFSEIIDYYEEEIAGDDRVELVMLHFFINSGIQDTMYYWNEFRKAVKLYCELRKVCPTLKALDIGGGMPIPHSLDFAETYDYEYMVGEMVGLLADTCRREGVPEPDIWTEFGKFTVGQSGALLLGVAAEKQQNDRESWYMVDTSLMNTLPDVYGIGQRYLCMPINKWTNPVKRVQIGGQSCDQADYYNQEVHQQDVWLPERDLGEPLYIGFFNMGAYQEALSGFGGLKHCLLPSPKHLLVDVDENGDTVYELFAEEQAPEAMMGILGY
jgi:arginine decarboxylase